MCESLGLGVEGIDERGVLEITGHGIGVGVEESEVLETTELDMVGVEEIRVLEIIELVMKE